MFNIFKEKCPVCKMNLKKDKDYPEEDGKKFCSDDCKMEYKKQLEEKQPKNSGGSCCH